MPARYLKHTKNRSIVLRRDGYSCSYINQEGFRCGEARGLQIDHIKPKGIGGKDTLLNYRTLCSKHNILSAGKVFGYEFINKKIEASKIDRIKMSNSPGAGIEGINFSFKNRSRDGCGLVGN